MQRDRDWRIAAGLSVIPGLGQLYNGQPRKALFFLAGTVFTIGPALVLLVVGESFGHSLLGGSHVAPFFIVAFGSVLVFLVLFVLGLFVWASAGADARRTAKAMGKRDAAEAARVSFFQL